MSTTDDTTDGLGTDGTIPNSPDGLAVGHDPNGSHFNPEEDDTTEADATTADGNADVDTLPDGSGSDAESSIEDDDDTDTASGGDAD